MSEELSSKVCSACRGDADPLKATESVRKMDELDDEWELVENHHIERQFEFDNFQKALVFVNTVGEIAEEQGHHPIINHFTWGRATVKLYTHKIDGLHENDFIMAAKIDEMHENEF
jgi:4a-hydroxytetrahydrobiopterin dehydratase